MNAKRFSIFAVLFGVLGLVTALYYANQTQISKSTVSAVTVERDILRDRLAAALNRPSRESQSSVPAPPDRQDTLQRNADPAPANHEVSALIAVKAWQTRSPANEAFESALARDAFITQEVLRAKAKFHDFFATAKLSAVEVAAIDAQLRNLSEAMLEYYRSVRNQGFGPTNPPQDPKVLAALLRMENDVLKEFESGVHGILGDGRYRDFTAYRKTIPERNVAEQLAGRIYDTENPLTSVQAAYLVQILTENRYQPGSSVSPTNTLNGVAFPNSTIGDAKGFSNLMHGDLMMPAISWSAPVTDAAITRAGAVLSPSQLTALRALQAEQAARYRLAPPSPPGATTEEALAAIRKSPRK